MMIFLLVWVYILLYFIIMDLFVIGVYKMLKKLKNKQFMITIS